jgi:DNA-binding transcriptional regulator YdaS (Cro superfamily)
MNSKDELHWLAALRLACEKDSQAAVARRLGLSPATISQVLKGTYKADLSGVEQRVRGAILGETVDCPILGDIRRHVCLDWQAKPFAATNEQRVRMFRACRDGCPYSKLKQETDE